MTVPAGKTPDNVELPTDLDSDYNMMTVFSRGLDLQLVDHRAGLDCAEVLRQIASKGFALHQATVEIQIGTQGRPQVK